MVPEQDGIKDTALESYHAIADVVWLESTVKYAALDCVSSLKIVAVIVICEINPYFLFSVEPKWGQREGGKPQMGGMPPPPIGAPCRQKG